MSPIGHCALGLALKPAAPKAPIWLLCAAAACADFLSMALFAIGVEGPVRGFPWSHGLLMSIVWSALAAALVFLCLRNARAALITGALVLSLKAGGTGLNLTAADYVIHMDPWWNPAVEDQATDRTHRIGQTRPVTVYRIVAKDTIEEQILALHANKRSLVSDVLSGSDQAGKLSTQELITLIRGDADDKPAAPNHNSTRRKATASS